RRRELPARIDPPPQGEDRGRLAAHHAGVRRPASQRNGAPAAHRLHKDAADRPDADAQRGDPSAAAGRVEATDIGGRAMSSDLTQQPHPAPESPDPTPAPLGPRRKPDYISVRYGILSWLFTLDHKRIAILYLVTITLNFFVGGFYAMLIRLELTTPQG